MIECPECGKHVRGTKCSCGWNAPQAKRLASIGGDPMYGCCDWIGDGRCHYPGVFKHGDKWLCRHHDSCTDPVLGAEIVQQSHAERASFDYASRKAASLRRVEREVEMWGNRYKEAA